MKKVTTALMLSCLTLGIVSPAFAITTLTSLTLEMSTNSGGWTNAPGGIWSTNLADPLTQLGVMQNGSFLNTPGNGLDLGEISIDLAPGINTFELFGTSLRGGSDYYGLSLFFDHHATPPDMGVFNSNSSNGPFSVTAAGTTVSGSANGGLFPDVAPGSSVFLAPDGSTVEVLRFTVLFGGSNPDLVSWGNIEPDGYPDVSAILELRYTPATQDSDNDGVPDDQDDCPHSILSAVVVIDGCSSGVTNILFPSGCTISDLITECADAPGNHGQFVRCVSHLTNRLKGAGSISGHQKGAIQRCAAQAQIP